MTRARMTAAKRVRVFDAAKSLCHLCRLPIHIGEKWHVEHVKALWSGGADDETNMAPAHIDCHATKSKEEAAPRAKTTAQRANHVGAGTPPKSVIPQRPREPRVARPIVTGPTGWARRFVET